MTDYINLRRFKMKYKNIINPKGDTLKKLLIYLHKSHFAIETLKTTDSKFLHYFYILEENKIIGIILLNLKPTKEDFNSYSEYYNIDITPEKLGIDIELMFFHVDENYRGLGLGSKLMNICLNNYNDKNIGLFTNSDTTEDAFHLYNKFGFKLKIKKPFKFFIRKGKN